MINESAEEKSKEELIKDNERLQAAAQASQRKYNELYTRHRDWMDLNEGKLLTPLQDTAFLVNKIHHLSVENDRLKSERDYFMKECKKRWYKEMVSKSTFLKLWRKVKRMLF